MAFLPFIQNIFNYISKVLTKSDMKTVNLPARKDSGLLHPVNEDSLSAHFDECLRNKVTLFIQLPTLLGANNIQSSLHTVT